MCGCQPRCLLRAIAVLRKGEAGLSGASGVGGSVASSSGVGGSVASSCLRRYVPGWHTVTLSSISVFELVVNAMYTTVTLKTNVFFMRLDVESDLMPTRARALDAPRRVLLLSELAPGLHA